MLWKDAQALNRVAVFVGGAGQWEGLVIHPKDLPFEPCKYTTYLKNLNKNAIKCDLEDKSWNLYFMNNFSVQIIYKKVESGFLIWFMI